METSALRQPGTGTRGMIVVACLTLLAWGGVLVGQFQYDDFPNLLNDPATGGGTALRERLPYGIRPLTRISHALDNQLWRSWAGGWLLTNLLLHLVTTIGVYLVARLRTGATHVATLAAALFALQPAHAMTVAYVSGRATGLLTVLLVFALHSYEKSTCPEESSARRARWLFICCLCYGLALLAKETALCFPLLLALWEITRPGGALPTGAVMRRLVPVLVITTVGIAAALMNVRYQQLLAYSLALRTPLDNLLHNTSALPATLSLLLRPWALSVLHAAPKSAHGLWAVMGAIGLLIAAIAFRRAPWLSFALLWPMLALLPSHSLIAKADAVSESGLYLCWVGPCLGLAMSAGMWRWRARSRATAMTRLMLLALSATCAWRAWVWSDPVRLWCEATRSVPTSARAWNNLGVAYLGRRDVVQARIAFDRALAIDPRHPRAHYNRLLLELVN